MLFIVKRGKRCETQRMRIRWSKNSNQVSDKKLGNKKKLPTIQTQRISVLIEFRIRIQVEYILNPFK